MTDYNRLARRIVAQLGGTHHSHFQSYYLPCLQDALSAEQFCHDWRVVGALMEKCGDFGGLLSGPDDAEVWQVRAWAGREGFGMDESLPIAIVLACLDALENSNG